MKKISDLSCVSPNGKSIHGTAAILHRLFNGTETTIEDDGNVRFQEYVVLIKKLGYDGSRD